MLSMFNIVVSYACVFLYFLEFTEIVANGIFYILLSKVFMKVLLVSPLPPPVGGIASWTVNVLDYYSGNESISLIHYNAAIKYRDITKTDFKSRFFSGVKDGFRNIIGFFRVLSEKKPDVVHVTSSGSMGLWKDLLVLLIAKIYRAPVIIHFRFGRIPNIRKLNNWEWKILKVVVSLSAATIVLDDETHKVLLSCGFKNIYNIPNPISKYVESFLSENNTSESEVKESIKKIIFVGHITKNKGVFELVEACSLLSNIDSLVFVGPYEKDIKDKILEISSLANLNTKFTGVLNKELVLAQIRDASMLVLPSYSEGFPNVIIEAMAMKCPVIATNVGAVASMLDFYSEKPAGIVVEPKNVQDLVGAINLITSDSSNVDFLKENAFFKVKAEYTLKKVCDQYEKIWLISNKHKKV